MDIALTTNIFSQSLIVAIRQLIQDAEGRRNPTHDGLERREDPKTVPSSQVGLLEEFSALVGGHSINNKKLNHALKIDINVSGYFILHFNEHNKVNRVEFHYYDV